LNALRSSRSEIRECRKDHALIAEALLCGAGKLDEAEALDWAEKNIKLDERSDPES
jgi:hypothetical protein